VARRVGGLVYAVGFACLGGKEGDYVDGHFGGFERCFLGLEGGWMEEDVGIGG
jgi:hypothetical protein